MFFPSFVLVLCLASVGGVVASPPSNLPDAPPGLFTVHGSSIIDADVDVTWAFLLDFPSYPDWNPFVRGSVVTDDFGKPLADQTPQLNATLRLTAQIPPLPAPVDADTPSNWWNERVSIEEIIHFNQERRTVAWRVKNVALSILDSVRWSAVSSFVDEKDGRTKTFYESRGNFDGALAGTLKKFYEEDLNVAFQAQADAMKTELEAA